MNKASQILFEQRFGNEGVKLFNSRIDLISNLLTNPLSEYHLSETELADPTLYTKELNRIQSYISQVFSGTATRKITSEFKTSLKAVLETKLKDIDPNSVPSLFEAIIRSLEEINIKHASDSSTSDQDVLKEFIQDFKNSNYATVFTSRPLELEANPSDSVIKIRNTIVKGISNYFLKNYPVKKFRFNFPNRQIGILFWRRISYLLIKQLRDDPDGEKQLKLFMEDIYSSNLNWNDEFKARLDKYDVNLEAANTHEEKLRLLVYHFLTHLNDNACFQVFESKEPVFVIPHIILNPNESNNMKGYIFLEKKNNPVELYKYGNRDLNVWKDKVWDTVKANKNTKQISYVESIEDTIFLNFI